MNLLHWRSVLSKVVHRRVCIALALPSYSHPTWQPRKLRLRGQMQQLKQSRVEAIAIRLEAITTGSKELLYLETELLGTPLA